MGACSSGAQDAHGFASAMHSGFMPEVDTLTYQGVFNEHLFHVGEQEKELAVTTQCFPIIDDGVPWLAVFLKSVFDGKPRNATPIDLSVVIDISGSMGGSMTFHRDTQAPGDGNRLEHAKRAVEWIVQEVLRSDDRLAVSTFNSTGHVVQPLARRGDMDCDSFLQPVRAIFCDGGTVLAAGMKVGREMLGTDFAEHRHRRILFLTDMGEMDATVLGQMIETNASDGVYVSIVAMGAEFNAALTETVTKNRGSNYFCATNNAQLRECLIDDFAFNMFPVAFDLDVSVCSGSLEVSGVYGTPFDTIEVDDLVRKWTPTSNPYYKPFSRIAASSLLLHSHSIRVPLPLGIIGNVIDFLEPPVTSITEVNTLFPSRVEASGAMKGGLILIQLRQRSSSVQCVERTASGTASHPVQVKLTYTDAVGKAFSQVDDVCIPGGVPNFMDAEYGATLSKALLLQRYAQVCREHMAMGNGTGQDESTVREAALPALLADLSQFKATANATFREDEQMQELVKSYEDFVKVFSKPFCKDDDQVGAKAPQDA